MGFVLAAIQFTKRASRAFEESVVGEDCLSGAVEEARRCAHPGVDGYQFVGRSGEDYFKFVILLLILFFFFFFFLFGNDRLQCCGRKFSVPHSSIIMNSRADIPNPKKALTWLSWRSII